MAQVKIDKKIQGYRVLSEEEKIPVVEPLDLESMHEKLKRPEMLIGSTYKIVTPQSEHALYITINDIILNEGTDNESLHPYEVFINSKNMEHFQWVLALTRVISAVFRKGGDACFLVEELKGVFDPKGGYFKKGGGFMPSLVAEIGCAIESHLKQIGMMKAPEMDNHQKEFLAAKRKEFDERNNDDADGSFPAKATICSKCQTKAVILMDGCNVCLNCCDSKCG